MKRRGIEIRRAKADVIHTPPDWAKWTLWANVSETREALYMPIAHCRERLTAEIVVQGWRLRQELEEGGELKVRALIP